MPRSVQGPRVQSIKHISCSSTDSMEDVTYCETGFVGEGRASVPGLHLVPEDSLHFTIVLASRTQQGLQNGIDGKNELRREWADIVHCIADSVCLLSPAEYEFQLHTKDIECVWRVGSAGDNERSKGGLQSH